MDVLGANRLQRVVCLKRSCGFSTQARPSGPCVGQLDWNAVDRRHVTNRGPLSGLPLAKPPGFPKKKLDESR